MFLLLTKRRSLFGINLQTLKASGFALGKLKETVPC